MVMYRYYYGLMCLSTVTVTAKYRNSMEKYRYYYGEVPLLQR